MVKERDIMISEFNNDMNLKCQESEHFQQEVKKLSAENQRLKKEKMTKKKTYHDTSYSEEPEEDIRKSKAYI